MHQISRRKEMYTRAKFHNSILPRWGKDDDLINYPFGICMTVLQLLWNHGFSQKKNLNFYGIRIETIHGNAHKNTTQNQGQNKFIRVSLWRWVAQKKVKCGARSARQCAERTLSCGPAHLWDSWRNTGKLDVRMDYGLSDLWMCHVYYNQQCNHSNIP